MDCTRGNGSHDPADDMDCDGPKHALVRDVDGSLLGSSPLESSIVPYAELRYSPPLFYIPILHSNTTGLMKVVLQRHCLQMLVHWIFTIVTDYHI